MLGALLQALIAIVLVVILALVGFYALFSDTRKAIVAGNGTHLRTRVMSGVIDAKTAPTQGYTFDTQNRFVTNYLPIGRSFNRRGGAELSYAFWMYKAAIIPSTETTTTAFADDGLKSSDIVLLIKGTTVVIPTPSQSTQTIVDVVTKCPLVKLDASTDRLTVEFNTSDDTHVNDVLEGSAAPPNEVSTRSAYASKVSVYGLNDPQFVGRWFHVAVVLRDSDPVNDRNKHIQARIYINGEAVFDRTVVGSVPATGVVPPTTLRQNAGFLYILPTLTLPSPSSGTTTSGDIVSPSSAHVNLRLADVWHANYALDEGDVQALYRRGVTKAAAAMPATQANVTGSTNQYLMSDPAAWQRVQTAS